MRRHRAIRRASSPWATSAFLALSMMCACGGAEPVERGVIIAEPADGAVVDGPDVRIMLQARNVGIRPAGTDEPNTGHHHLFVDRDVTPVGEPIPAEPGIIHLGGGQTEYVLEALDPGEHAVIAVLGDHRHVRLAVGTDTVRFTVGGGD